MSRLSFHRELAQALVLALTLGGCMSHQAPSPSGGPSSVARFATTDAIVRYQSTDLERAIAFYTTQLGFRLDQHNGPVATVSRGALHVLLSGPGSSGSRPMPDGRRQEPGGWNRIVLYVDDLAALVTRLRAAGGTFRNDVESGPGGKQIQIEDPDGNPIEIHEPPR
jgi:catechol 2,3-dioxygenase-like lactoylglutathione lyase family enzyme